MEIILMPPASRDVCQCLEDPHLFSFFRLLHQPPNLHRTKSGVYFNATVLSFPFPGSSLNLLVSAFVGVYNLCSNHPVCWEVKIKGSHPKR